MPTKQPISIIQLLLSVFLLLILGCQDVNKSEVKVEMKSETHIVVLGIAQDAGYPQSGCMKSCCEAFYNGEQPAEKVSSIGIVDAKNQIYWIVDATPDFKAQLRTLKEKYPNFAFGGILLTHAHMGHYTGLMHLGREAMGADQIPVYALPRMADFLSKNGPWSQLVQLKNISIQVLEPDQELVLSSSIKIVPFLVPHRDEYSETVGFTIKGNKKSLMFLPDIDKWNKWERDIRSEIKSVDFALLDGSFFKNGEIKGRDMSLIPHPFVEESLQLFKDLSSDQKSKIHFIHFNHTNPLINSKSDACMQVHQHGIGICREEDVFNL